MRVLEEAVTNALRHGHAGRLAVAFRVSDENQLSIVVDDDGSGIPEGAELSGLDRLHERIKGLGGTLLLGRGALAGTRLVVMIPVG